MKKTMCSLAPLLMAAAQAAQAHAGHGLPGSSHWHATDIGGYAFVIAVAIATAAALWWRGGK